MDENRQLMKIRNFVLICGVYISLVSSTVWSSAVIIYYLTNDVRFEIFSLVFFKESILMIYAWISWLKLYWSQLPWDAYKYLKLKLISAIIIPHLNLAIIIIFYHKKINNWKYFKPSEKIHGDARWADEDDIKKANLRAKHGMLLGKDEDGLFVADGFQHAMLFAPTGSGKGVGFVIPNLLFWEHSVIVHDIKLENYDLTSGWRKKQGQEVYVWEPSNPNGITHCYNPIDWVSDKPGKMVDDVQKISNLILPKKDFWENEARSLFVGVVLYIIADPHKRQSFGEVVRVMRSDDVAYNLAVALDTMGNLIHPVSYMNLAAFLQKADKERSGVISTLNSSLELWANPLIDTATATSDFNISLFKKKKTTVYVGLTPDNIDRLQRLMQVFYQQATEFLSTKMPDLKEEPYGVMFLMDEFPTLGKMDLFKTGIAYFRGYRVRLFLIIQDVQQLKGAYEDAGMNSFLSNSTFRITFAANNYETANMISQLCGNKTVKQASHSTPKFFDLNPATRTMNISEVQRALLLPQEVITLPKEDQIILIESMPPIRSKKILYFNDKFFTSRLLPKTEVPTQVPYTMRKTEEENSSDDEDNEDNEDDEYENSHDDLKEYEKEYEDLEEELEEDEDLEDEDEDLEDEDEDLEDEEEDEENEEDEDLEEEEEDKKLKDDDVLKTKVETKEDEVTKKKVKSSKKEDK